MFYRVHGFWPSNESKTYASSHSGLVSWMYLQPIFDVHTAIGTRYLSLRTLNVLLSESRRSLTCILFVRACISRPRSHFHKSLWVSVVTLRMPIPQQEPISFSPYKKYHTLLGHLSKLLLTNNMNVIWNFLLVFVPKFYSKLLDPAEQLFLHWLVLDLDYHCSISV